jgi:hypothetical protein
MLTALGVYIQMYGGRPCRGSNLNHKRANPPLWPLDLIPAPVKQVNKDMDTMLILMLFLITCSVYTVCVRVCVFTNTFLFYCFYGLFTFILYVGVSVTCVDGVWKGVTDARTDWKSRHCQKSLSFWIKCEIKSNQIIIIEPTGILLLIISATISLHYE